MLIIHICRIWFQHTYQYGPLQCYLSCCQINNFQSHSLTWQDKAGNANAAVWTSAIFFSTFVVSYSIKIVLQHNTRMMVCGTDLQPKKLCEYLTNCKGKESCYHNNTHSSLTHQYIHVCKSHMFWACHCHPNAISHLDPTLFMQTWPNLPSNTLVFSAMYHCIAYLAAIHTPAKSSTPTLSCSHGIQLIHQMRHSIPTLNWRTITSLW